MILLMVEWVRSSYTNLKILRLSTVMPINQASLGNSSIEIPYQVTRVCQVES